MQLLTKIWILSALGMTSLFTLKGQTPDPFIISLKEKLDNYTAAFRFEDLYIHTDRETYIAGEYCYFAVYLFDRRSLTLSEGSTYAYAELIDNENRPVAQVKVLLNEGRGAGGFTINDSLPNGEYILRAYTSMMRNYLPDGCFMKKILVYNPFRDNLFHKAIYPGIQDNQPYQIVFFPESGKLLEGFLNRVAVKACFRSGPGRVIRGYVTNNAKDTICSVTIDKEGIGSFEFQPRAGNEYQLVCENGRSIFRLPPVSRSGLVVSVKNDPGRSLRIVVNSNEERDPDNNFFYLVIESGGKLLYGTRALYDGRSTQVNVPAEKLLSGICQALIFNAAGSPVCTRNFFVSGPEKDPIALRMEEKTGRRQKVILEIETGSNMSEEKRLSGMSLSVSVSDKQGSKPDIKDYINAGSEYKSMDGQPLLSSGIFASSAEDIDDYMLTLKSNWIIIDNIIRDKSPSLKYMAEYRKQFLNGYYSSNNMSEKGGKMLFLSVPGKVPVFKYVITDSDNRFSFEIRDKEYLNDFVIQPVVPVSNYSLQIESPFSKEFPSTVAATDSSDWYFNEETVKWSVNYQVSKIYGIDYSTDTMKRELPYALPIRFYGKPDQELLLKNYISLPSMQEVFFELVPDVSIRKVKSKYGFYMRDPFSKKFYENSPLLLVDGVITEDPSSILNLDPEIVEKVDVITGEYVVGEIVFFGIVSVFTRPGDFANIPLPEAAIRIKDRRYDMPERFNPPDYSTPPAASERIPDFRNTLYWNPDIKPDNTGKIRIEFWTSDFSSYYDIILQGFTGTAPLSVRKKIKVE